MLIHVIQKNDNYTITINFNFSNLFDLYNYYYFILLKLNKVLYLIL